MTRVNLISVGELYDQHLLAEHREIKRIPNVIKSGKYSLSNIPEKFCLGTGHVKFFYNKLSFLYKRYEELYIECKKRNFNIEYYGENWLNMPTELLNDWIVSEDDIKLSKARIQEKIEQKPLFYKFYGNNIR